MNDYKRYCITDGKNFVYRNGAGKYVTAPGEEMADHFSEKRARTLLSSMKKHLSGAYHIALVSTRKTERATVVDQNPKVKLVAPDMNSIMEIASKYSEIRKHSDERQKELSEQLSVIDRKISEVLHAIEFGHNYNTPGGYKVYAIIRDLRRERRKIKDEMYVLSMITSDKVNSAEWETLANGNRKYDYKYFDNVHLRMKG